MLTNPGQKGHAAPKQAKAHIADSMEKLRTFARRSPMIGAVSDALDCIQEQIIETRSSVGKLSYDLIDITRHLSETITALNDLLANVYGKESSKDARAIFPEGLFAGMAKELIETQSRLEELTKRVDAHGNNINESQILIINALGFEGEQAPSIRNDNAKLSASKLLDMLCREDMNVAAIREFAIARGPIVIKHALENLTQIQNAKYGLECKYLGEGNEPNADLKKTIELNAPSLQQRAQFFLEQIDWDSLTGEAAKLHAGR